MRVKFPSGRQQAFLQDVQRLTGESAASLASQVGVCARTLRDWRREKWQMDDLALNRLCRVAHLPNPPHVTLLPEHWSVQKAARLGGLRRAALHGPLGTFESRQRGGRMSGALIRNDPELARQRGLKTRKAIRIPPQNEELAELIGIFLGDGGFRNAWQIAISFNPHADRAYAEFIHILVKRLFGLEATWQIRESWGSGDLLISSTALVEFFERMGLRRGRKTPTSVAVPDWIESDRTYRIACLRGLMDTDGSVYQHRYRVRGGAYVYPKLSFTSIIPRLCRFVERTLRELNLSAFYHQRSHQVFVHDSDGVRCYFETVGTHNPRYRERFEQYLAGSIEAVTN